MDGTSSSTWRKSTYSSANGGGCVEVGTVPWRKSTHSGPNGGGCVEAGTVAGAVLIRDTTNRAAGALRVSPAAFRELVTRIRRAA